MEGLGGMEASAVEAVEAEGAWGVMEAVTEAVGDWVAGVVLPGLRSKEVT